MYDAYKMSEIFTHLLINIFISKVFLSLFDITIPILDANWGTLIDTFWLTEVPLLTNAFVIF